MARAEPGVEHAQPGPMFPAGTAYFGVALNATILLGTLGLLTAVAARLHPRMVT